MLLNRNKINFEAIIGPVHVDTKLTKSLLAPAAISK